MVRSLWGKTHFLYDKTDISSNILTSVKRSNIHVAGAVDGLQGVLAVFILFKQVELDLRADLKGDPRIRRFLNGLFQQGPGISVKGRAVGIGDITEHVSHASPLGTPGQMGQGPGIGMQIQIRADVQAESDGDAVLEGTGQLIGHDGDIPLPSVDIAEGKTDEFDVLFLNVVHDFFRCIFHDELSSLRTAGKMVSDRQWKEFQDN